MGRVLCGIHGPANQAVGSGKSPTAPFPSPKHSARRRKSSPSDLGETQEAEYSRRRNPYRQEILTQEMKRAREGGIHGVKRKISNHFPAARALASSSRIMRITSARRFSTRARSSSFARRRSSYPANHSSRARSSSSGFAWATMHEFIARRCWRQIHVAVTVRLTAHSANAIS